MEGTREKRGIEDSVYRGQGHRTFLDALKTSVDNDQDWNEKVAEIVWGINNTRNSSTGCSPYELLFGHKWRLLTDLEGGSSSNVDLSVAEKRDVAGRKLEQVAVRMKVGFDKKHKPSQKYKKGELVLWKGGVAYSNTGVNTKLDRRCTGPYIIEKVLENDRYKIRSLNGLKGYK